MIALPESIKRVTLTFKDKATGANTSPINHELVGPVKWFGANGFSHVLCFSICEQTVFEGENIINVKSEDAELGSDILVVHDVALFTKRISRFMKKNNIKFQCGPVEYVDTRYEGAYDAFKKPNRFVHQHEYRLAIYHDEINAVEFTIPGVEETLEVFKGLRVKFSA